MQPYFVKALSILIPLCRETSGDPLNLVLDTTRGIVHLMKDLMDESTAVHIADEVYQTWTRCAEGEAQSCFAHPCFSTL